MRRWHPLLIDIATRVRGAEIVLRVLIEIFRSNRVTSDPRFTREGNVALEYLMGVAPNLQVGAIAVEGVAALGRSGLVDWPVTLVAPAWALV